MMALQVIGTGLLIMFLTTVIQGAFMMAGAHVLEWRLEHHGPVRHPLLRATVVSVLTLWMFLAIVVEVWMWALLYLYNPLITALPDLETAFYFSMVTFTTLGYGDITLAEEWRLASAFQAANGVIIAGWSTALVIAVVQKIYNNRHSTRLD